MTDTDDLSDRAAGWAKRKGDDDEGAQSDRDEHDDRSTRSERSEPAEPDGNGERLRNPANVKEAWDGGYYYIPPDISEEADEALDRLQYECRDIDIKKNRHFNVVLVVDGLRAIQEMDGDAFKDRLDELGLR